MTQKRLRYLAQTYGGVLSLWPDADRGPAEDLLMHYPEAHAILQKQEEMDLFITQAFAAQDAQFEQQSAHEDAYAALTRLRAGVAGRIARQEDTRSRAKFDWRSIVRRSAPPMVWVTMADNIVMVRRSGLVLGCVFTVMGGVWLGWIQSSGGPADLINALLEIPVSGGGS